MRIHIPSKKVCERFLLIYELEGCQRAVNYLTEYYGVRRLKLIVDGRRVMRTKTHKTYEAHYYRNKAYFTKKSVNKRNVLHELYHHIVEAKGLEMTLTKEEKEANGFVREVLMEAKAV
jgi:hypothetical protein